MWLTIPSCTLLELMTSSGGGCRSSKKKTVQFALPGRIIRPLQWRDDVIWARVETPRQRQQPHGPLDEFFQPVLEGGHRRTGSNCSSIDSTYANSSSQDDDQSSSSRESVSVRLGAAIGYLFIALQRSRIVLGYCSRRQRTSKQYRS